ncbi:hypothetical protein FO519_005604 [Halicephalobus sp. NKZ332]|nr:hypothetical protein FO519_005604 [Halicephalobus sp. NKZ332]
MGKIFPICGPTLSTFCMIISVWGVVFLGLLGLFFSMKAVTLFPDLHLEESSKFDVHEVEERYVAKATQCWIAAGLYAVTFIGVWLQNRYNPPLLIPRFDRF